MARVEGVHSSPTHSFSKSPSLFIRLIAGRGVDGDAHFGEKVKHRSRVARDPDQPNLRQVHLIHAELFDELKGRGFEVAPGLLGENITTHGLDLLALPVGARLHVGECIIELTGLRNPCVQLDRCQPGLMQAVLDRDADGELIRKSGVMGIVIAGGVIRPGDEIRVELPAGEYRRLTPV